MNALLDRLKRSRLGQWCVAYLAGSWFLLQLLDVVGARWGVSVVMERAVDVVLIGGLLITLVLVWYHGEKGRQRVSGAELLIIASLLVVLGALIPAVVSVPPAATLGPTPASTTSRPSVAVLPFQSISQDTSNAFFAEGLHDELVHQLSKLRGMDMISRTSTLLYRDSRPPMAEIARELGVTAVAEGTVRIVGDRVRVTIQLIDGPADRQLFSKEFDRELTAQDLFAIQDHALA